MGGLIRLGEAAVRGVAPNGGLTQSAMFLFVASQIARRGLAAQCPMRTVVVITIKPTRRFVTQFVQVAERVHAEHLLTERPVEPLDISVLSRLAGLDRHQLDVVLLRPLFQCLGDKLRTIIRPQLPGATAFLGDWSSTRTTRADGSE